MAGVTGILPGSLIIKVASVTDGLTPQASMLRNISLMRS
jgi:hypothetical protein